MKIIFLDIDGVLNSNEFFKNNHASVLLFCKKNSNNWDNINISTQRQMMDIDFNKLRLLKSAIDETEAKVVITSSWKKIRIYSSIVQKLIELGIPVIDCTIDNDSDRGTGIKKYLLTHNVSNYVILDDDVFDDYDDEILSNLIKTNFYNGGLQQEHKEEIVRKLRNKH